MVDTWRLDGGNVACETVGIGSRKQQVEGTQYKCYTQHICCNFHFLTDLKDSMFLCMLSKIYISRLIDTH